MWVSLKQSHQGTPGPGNGGQGGVDLQHML
jgi:hypothetical protein